MTEEGPEEEKGVGDERREGRRRRGIMPKGSTALVHETVLLNKLIFMGKFRASNVGPPSNI